MSFEVSLETFTIECKITETNVITGQYQITHKIQWTNKNAKWARKVEKVRVTTGFVSFLIGRESGMKILNQSISNFKWGVLKCSIRSLISRIFMLSRRNYCMFLGSNNSHVWERYYTIIFGGDTGFALNFTVIPSVLNVYLLTRILGVSQPINFENYFTCIASL